MKKIFNFGLALAVVAAMALVGCSGGSAPISDDTGFSGDTTIENGTFGAKGITGAPSAKIAVGDSTDTDGELKYIEFKNNDALKFFKGESSEFGKSAKWLDEPRSVETASDSDKNFTAKYSYWDIVVGGKATAYHAEKATIDEYPAVEDMDWTKYTVFDGTKNKFNDADDMNYGWKDKKAEDSASYTVAIDGKYFKVYSDGSKLTDSEKKMYSGSGDKFTYTVDLGNGAKKEDKCNIETGSVVVEFEDGGTLKYKVTYKCEKYGIDEKGKDKWETTLEYVIGDAEGNAAEGEWYNVDGLIVTSIPELVIEFKSDYDSAFYGWAGQWIGACNKWFNADQIRKGDKYFANPIFETKYWNGLRLDSASYIGTAVEEIPEAALNAKNEEKNYFFSF